MTNTTKTRVYKRTVNYGAGNRAPWPWDDRGRSLLTLEKITTQVKHGSLCYSAAMQGRLTPDLLPR